MEKELYSLLTANDFSSVKLACSIAVGMDEEVRENIFTTLFYTFTRTYLEHPYSPMFEIGCWRAVVYGFSVIAVPQYYLYIDLIDGDCKTLSLEVSFDKHFNLLGKIKYHSIELRGASEVMPCMLPEIVSML
jgi:hypothetical protein